MQLYLIRGLPGSGKSTLAKKLAPNESLICEADQYFEGRDFNPKLLGKAHEECLKKARYILSYGGVAVVSNTFTREDELEPYIDLAKELGINYTVLIVENRHGGKSIHGVPEKTVEKMKRRFSVCL